MALPPILQRIVDFLRAGYPEGVPQQDYLPLFALLGHDLSPDEVAMLADELASHSAQAVREAYEKAPVSTPAEDELRRVRARLEAAGWLGDEQQSES